MKKIMFNDRYGLTQAVLEGKKTMTRRIIPDIEIDWVRRGRVKLPVGGFENDVLFMNVRSILPDAGISDYAAPAKYQPRPFRFYSEPVGPLLSLPFLKDF